LSCPRHNNLAQTKLAELAIHRILSFYHEMLTISIIIKILES